MALRIITNHHDRYFKLREEVPEDILERQFDWCDEVDGFLRYRGIWYHLSDFIQLSPGSLEASQMWHGAHGDSYFSGVLIRLSDDGETYRIGRYYHVSGED